MRYSYDETTLRDAVSESKSLSGTLRNLHMSVSGGNSKTLKKFISLWKIDTSHWIGHSTWSIEKIPNESLFVEKSNRRSSVIKKRIFKDGLLPRQCANDECPTRALNDWLGKPIPLQLDHINGINTDNRLENLRILCAMCHCNTDTWGGRQRPKNAAIFLCIDCGEQVSKGSNRCVPCFSRWQSSKKHKTKIDWPSNEDLLASIQNHGLTGTASILGVNYNGIKKRLKRAGLWQPLKKGPKPK